MDKWDLRFIGIAREVAGWSKDPNRKVGAVVVKDRRMLSTGYNGLPSGYPDDYTNLGNEQKNALTIHAEANAVANAPCDLKGVTIYVAGLHPCAQCAALIAQSGITRVVYDFEPNRDSSWSDSVAAAKDIFKQCGVQSECVLPKVVLIGGKKGSGKSWVASRLGMPVRAFADAPKAIFKKTFGVDFDEVKHDVRPIYGGLTARGCMQRFATDAAQGVLGASVWRDYLLEVLQQDKLNGIEKVAICDWRFPQETIPGALRIYVLGGVQSDKHQSENAIGPDDADMVLDNTDNRLTKDDMRQLATMI